MASILLEYLAIAIEAVKFLLEVIFNETLTCSLASSLTYTVWFSVKFTEEFMYTASALAEKGYIAVYPVIGWWKERANFERWGKSARYALVVSIKTPEVETDIYTAVENQIAVPVTI